MIRASSASGMVPLGHEGPYLKHRSENRSRGWRCRAGFRNAERRAGRPRAGARASCSAGSTRGASPTPPRAHFANPRNDFWRLLHDAGFTPRLFEPREQFALLQLGIGVTNAAYRTTKGSGDLRRADFAGAVGRLGRIADELRPGAIAFVGKEAYRGTFGERADLGPQIRTLGDVGLFVLPSTSPANAAVPYAERLRWFVALARLARAGRPRGRARSRPRPTQPDAARAVRRHDRPGVVGDAGRRRRRRRDHGADDPPRARGGRGAGRPRPRSRDLDPRPHVRLVRPRSTGSANGSISSAWTSTGRRRASTSPPSTSTRCGGGHSRSSIGRSETLVPRELPRLAARFARARPAGPSPSTPESSRASGS